MENSSKRISILLAGAMAMLLAGCTSSKNVAWTSPGFKGHSIGKTVVLATFEDEYLSREFEAVFAQRLRDYVPAVSLRADVENTDKLDRKGVEKLLKQNQVKTLVVTHLVNSSQHTQLVPYGVSYQTYATATDDCYTYCSSYQLDENVESFSENTIETSLFDVATGKLIWSGLFGVYDFNSKNSNMEKVVNNTVWDLEQQGMLKANMVY